MIDRSWPPWLGQTVVINSSFLQRAVVLQFSLLVMARLHLLDPFRPTHLTHPPLGFLVDRPAWWEANLSEASRCRWSSLLGPTTASTSPVMVLKSGCSSSDARPLRA